MATICVFGDSIAWGAVDPENGGWVSSLRNYFESKSLRADLDTDVYNLGISGDNTDDLLERFDVEVEARKPDTIVFAIGINDAQFLIPIAKTIVSGFRALTSTSNRASRSLVLSPDIPKL